jgi:hypothetical protein
VEAGGGPEREALVSQARRLVDDIEPSARAQLGLEDLLRELGPR